PLTSGEATLAKHLRAAPSRRSTERRDRRGSPSAQALLFRPIEREGMEHGFEGVLGPTEMIDPHDLVLQDLVVLEEALDLRRRVARQLLDVAALRERRVVQMDGDDLVVDQAVLLHAHDAD